MEIRAELNYLRISPRKVRAVAELLKGLEVDQAQAHLRYLVKRPAKPFLKLLNSAVFNAQHNFGLDKNYLYIKKITVNEGMKLKRYKPKGFALAMPIQKKTSHIRLILDELPEEKKKRKETILAKRPKFIESKKEIKEIVEKKELGEKKVKTEAKPRIEKDKRAARKGVFGGIKTFGRKLFRRKAI